MEFKKVTRVQKGNYINRYNLTYETVDHQCKVYEMISRDSNIRTYNDLVNNTVDAVVLILENETHDKILLNREFRMAIGDWIYNFPAGLIDPGESPIESGRRELKEETGLDLVDVKQVLEPSYSAVGFSNEKTICLIGTAKGDFAPSSSTLEEIHADWYSRHKVFELLKNQKFAARTQAYCWLWANMGSNRNK